METTESIDVQIEKQQLIVNINMMREKIGLSRSSFEYLWEQSLEWLRNEQETTIQHYNEALRNKI
jgi:hypothetical protein